MAGGAVLVKTPKMETIRRDVRRQRAVLAAYPPPIADDTLLQIPNPYDLTTTGEQFIQYDNGRHDLVLIFGSTESLNIVHGRDIRYSSGAVFTILHSS